MKGCACSLVYVAGMPQNWWWSGPRAAPGRVSSGPPGNGRYGTEGSGGAGQHTWKQCWNKIHEHVQFGLGNKPLWQLLSAAGYIHGHVEAALPGLAGQGPGRHLMAVGCYGLLCVGLGCNFAAQG